MIPYNSDEQFRVERGYLNRTRIYLYPIVVTMKSYRPFMVDLKENLLCTSYLNESLVLYYDRANTRAIKAFIDALKQNKEYVDDWMHNEKSYAIRIKPQLNYAAFEEGRYSDIYESNIINKAFSKDSKTRKVLIRDPEYKKEFVELLNKWFNTRHTVESMESRPDGGKVELTQFDVPPQMNQEVLDYNGKETINRGRIKTVRD